LRFHARECRTEAEMRGPAKRTVPIVGAREVQRIRIDKLGRAKTPFPLNKQMQFAPFMMADSTAVSPSIAPESKRRNAALSPTEPGNYLKRQQNGASRSSSISRAWPGPPFSQSNLHSG